MIKTFSFSHFAAVTFLLNSLTIQPAAAAIGHNNHKIPPISFKNTAVVSGSAIKAGSLIKNCDENTRKELANIQLGRIPNPLGELVLKRETISSKLGILASSAQIPESITVKRAGAILKGEEVKSKIEEYCSKDCEEKLNFDFSRLASTIVLPGNIVSWKVTSNSNNKLGMRLFALEAETDGGTFKQLIQVSVSKTIEAAELCQLAKPGESITEDMIKPVSVTIKNEKNNTAVAYKDVIGKTLDRFKSAGTIIRNSDLSKNHVKTAKTTKSKRIEAIKTPQALTMMSVATKNDALVDSWMVKPGENVEFRVNSGALSLSIPAKAVQGGNAGDEIELINLKNKRRISGVITEKGIVEYAQK